MKVIVDAHNVHDLISSLEMSGEYTRSEVAQAMWDEVLASRRKTRIFDYALLVQVACIAVAAFIAGARL